VIVVRYKRILSTNVRAKALASRDAPNWTVVVSDVQTRGRGRKGRRWESHKGGLWFSVILRPKLPAGKLSLLQFLGSNATRRAVAEQTGVQASTKWPNDLVLKSGKLAGILVESKSVDDKVSFVIVGIGLNVNQTERQLPAGATSILVSSGHEHRLDDILKSTVDNMKSQNQSLNDPAKILDEWWRNCIHRSRLVQVETPTGIVKGTSIGIDPEGSLLIETGKLGVETVVEGRLRI